MSVCVYKCLSACIGVADKDGAYGGTSSNPLTSREMVILSYLSSTMCTIPMGYTCVCECVSECVCACVHV